MTEAAPNKRMITDPSQAAFVRLLRAGYARRWASETGMSYNWRCYPAQSLAIDFHIECELEEDGRWIGEVPELPGVLVYGASSDEATLKVQALALRVIAETPGAR